METDYNLDFDEFKKAITPQHLLTFRIIYLALFMGITVFLGIVLLIAYSKSSPEMASRSTEFLSTLTIVHVVLAATGYLICAFFFQFLTNPARLQKTGLSMTMPMGQQISAVSMEQKYLVVIFSAYLVRAAFFEGVALFGLIICLLGALDGTLQQHPAYWLNLFSYVAMVGMMACTFPNREKLEQLFTKRCVIKPPHVC